MNCNETRERLLDRRRGRSPEGEAAEIDRHLSQCESCRQVDAEDRELSRALERLPKRRAPAELRSAVENRLAGAPAGPAKPARSANTRPIVVTAIVGALAVAAGTVFVLRTSAAPNAMMAEAVNDHLRVLYSEHPIEIESGGVHQVKPWFAGRIDFAPVVAFAGDDDFPLQGGSIAYFIDRKAAAYVYKRRLHVITLFVYPAAGLPWPAVPNVHLGHALATEQTSRGFHALVWRDGDLGYALVSDLDERELEVLGTKIVGP